MIHLHQCYFSNDGSKPPQRILENIEKTRERIPHNQYRLYSLEDARDFLSSYDKTALWAFDSLKPLSYKADLMKYCLLEHDGGWYWDVGVYPENYIEVDNNVTALFFTDSLDTSNGLWRIAASVMYVREISFVFSKAIDAIIHNCRNKYYGNDPLYPTSTVLLGEIFNKEFFTNYPSVMLGEGKLVADQKTALRKALTLMDEIVCWYKERGGDLSQFGSTGTNNYNDLWHSRQAYA
jgi:hypothetical protein